MDRRWQLPLGTIHSGEGGFRYWARRIDWPLMAVVGILVSIGFVAVFSAVTPLGQSMRFIVKQFAAVVIGVGLCVALSQFNYQFLRGHSKSVYLLTTLLLALVLVFGKRVNGAKSWFAMGPVSFEPVELSRIGIIIVLAALLDTTQRNRPYSKMLFAALALSAFHMVLILFEPYLGGTLVYLPITLGMLYFSGVPTIYLMCLLTYGAFSVGIPMISTFASLQPHALDAYPFIQLCVRAAHYPRGVLELIAVCSALIAAVWWLMRKFHWRTPWHTPLLLSLVVACGIGSAYVTEKSLKDYQRKRIMVYLRPGYDALGAGYHILQSEIAIGSGRVFGKGLFSGTQTQLGFLPERHTDFIFSVIGEELGFVWAAVILMGFGVLIWRAFVIAMEAPDQFGALIAVGIGCKFAFECVMNIGMVLGLLPVTGVALPFVSYGGSHMVGAFMAIGLLQSVNFRRYIY